MTIDLDEALRTAGTDLHLDRPVDAVLARGDRLRRRRRGLRLGAAAAALVTAGGVVVLALPSASSPTRADDPVVAGPVVSLSPEELAAADETCTSMFRDMADAPDPHAQPDAVITRDGNSVLLYRYGGMYAVCLVQPSPNGAARAAGGSTGGPWLPLPAGRHFALIGGSFANDLTGDEIGHVDGHLSHGISAYRVEPDVARLVLRIGDQDVEAQVGDELAICFPPDGILMSEYDAATITAYAADGTELETRAILDSLAPEE